MSKPPNPILDTQLIPNTLVACGTLLIYDCLCNLDQEVAYVWSSSWSVGKALYFLNRYLPFIDTFLSLKLKLAFNSPETCKTQFQVVTWSIVVGIMISEAVLMLRTYALWECRRSVLIILGISAAVTMIPTVVITELELLSLRYIPNDVAGCRLSSASPIIIVAYILLALFETLMAALTAIKASQHLKQSQSRWVVQLYRDGLLFYVYLLLLSIANILLPITVRRVPANWLATPQRVMHSILCNRVLLLILKQRSATSMTMRHDQPILTTLVDDDLGTNMTIMSPMMTTEGTIPSMAVLDDEVNHIDRS